jgi:Rhodopirellula transposase DDE domain
LGDASGAKGQWFESTRAHHIFNHLGWLLFLFAYPEPTQINLEVSRLVLGKAAPYGVYDLAANQGWVSVGIDHDTAEFAVESICRWWKQMGKPLYSKATRLLITADGGGSNGYCVRLWKEADVCWRREQGRLTIGCRMLSRMHSGKPQPVSAQ